MMLREGRKMALIPDVDRRRMEANRKNKTTIGKRAFDIIVQLKGGKA